jgi:hypothetical protein
VAKPEYESRGEGGGAHPPSSFFLHPFLLSLPLVFLLTFFAFLFFTYEYLCKTELPLVYL